MHNAWIWGAVTRMWSSRKDGIVCGGDRRVEVGGTEHKFLWRRVLRPCQESQCAVESDKIRILPGFSGHGGTVYAINNHPQSPTDTAKSCFFLVIFPFCCCPWLHLSSTYPCLCSPVTVRQVGSCEWAVGILVQRHPPQ